VVLESVGLTASADTDKKKLPEKYEETIRMSEWLIADCYVEDPEGGAVNFIPHLDGEPTTVFRAARGCAPHPPDHYRGIVITGSAASVTEREDWVIDLVDYIQGACRANVPVLGVCFGHQVLAEALVGPHAIRKSPTPEVGWYDIHQDVSDPLLQGLPSSFRTFLSHHDDVRPDIVSSLQVLAHSQRCPVQAFRKPGSLTWGVQFHAEMALSEAIDLVHRRVGVSVPGDPKKALDRATDSTHIIHLIMANFTRLVRQSIK